MALAPYATLADLKARLGEETSARDAELTSFINAATDAIEQFCSRDFGAGTRTEYGSGAANFIMPRAEPISAVTSLTIDGTVVASKVVLQRKGVARADGVEVEGDWALVYVTNAPVPESVKLATLMTAQAMSDAPAFDTNLTGVSVAGVVQGGFQQTGAGNIPLGAQSLLNPYIRRFQP